MAQRGDLTLRRFDDVDAFESVALPYLMEREAEHNLFIGICGQIREGRWGEDPYLSTIERDGRIIGGAFRTPPHQLGLSRVEERSAIPLLAEDVRSAYDDLPGVVGAKDDAAAFATCWKELSGRSAELAMEQRIYQATESTDPFGAPGEMRNGSRDDREQLIEWFLAFHEEVGGILGDTARNVDLRLEGRTSGVVGWWDAGRMVSIAGWGAPTPNGIRVGPVYTPPELRGRGYAGSCTAALTRRLLDESRRTFVFLYTDLANPTSNSIYQKIGYRPVCDVDQYHFV